MNALTQNPAFWVALIFGLVILYILPSLIGAIRQVESLGWLIVINLLPTGVGWLAALIGAFLLPRREPRQPDMPSQFHQPRPDVSPLERDKYDDVVDQILRADEQRQIRESGHAP